MTTNPLADADYVQTLLRQVGDTKYCVLELALLGEQVLSWVNLAATMGHTTPGASLNYTRPTGILAPDMVRDFVAWTSGRTDMAPGCKERLLEHNVASGWHAHKLTESLTTIAPDSAVTP